ncbi:MAG: two-component system sensor histidine kinase CreC [Candidatus Thiodiazotropha sp. (ex Dulcina madagascariensis)]|nr:two-component system sensor histidine kinase CreC [Candidatus Thiodiazotropha sp. (ex Dulcina madagascariensis)]
MRFRPGFSFRIALLYFLLIGGLFWFILHKALDTLDASVRQAAEDVMVDTANLLAEQVTQQSRNGVINTDRLDELISAYLARPLNAQIYSVFKASPDMQVYVTDAEGIVLFDSTGQHEDADFSAWRDVWLTLQGEYGARSSAVDITTKVSTPQDRVMYVAAAIYNGDDIIGVLTVSKEVRHLDPFIISASQQLRTYAAVVLIISLLFGAAVAWWLSRSIRKLIIYADDLAAGRRISAPKLQEHEFDKLSQAMEKMHDELEGKRYVEEYIHTMAHELKSPLSGIQAAVELLDDDAITLDRRKHFAQTISESAERMTRLVERLLELAALEQRRHLENTESFNLSVVIDEIVKDRQHYLDKKEIDIVRLESDNLEFVGERLLISQAISNLVDNAIDFSPPRSMITLDANLNNGKCSISIQDQGPGIPDYAMEKIYERFYSLPRPHNQKRSSGLGLSFVHEVLNLHQGRVELSNQISGGVIARLIWPYPILHTNHTDSSH